MIKGNKLSRYKNVYQILNLAIWIQSRMQGASLAEMCEKLEVSRRTAERIRDCMLDVFYPNFDEIPTEDKVKRWGFKSFVPALVNFDTDDIAELESAKLLIDKSSSSHKSEAINGVINKIKALNKNNLLKFENDLEPLLEAEGFAISQHSKQVTPKETILTIREAIKAQKYLSFDYQKSKDPYKVKVAPYGVIYANKNYLVAYDDNSEKYKIFNLAKIFKIETASDYFDKDETFNLQEYSSNSFGIYQEEPIEVKVVFKEFATEDVLNYHFHPTQKITKQKDGTALVEFIAGGTVAMCWEFFKWGDSIQSIQPEELKNKYMEMLTKAKLQ